MKVEIVSFSQEGFVSAYALKFENGFILRGPTLLWLGKEEKQAALQQFNEVVEALQTQQIEIVGNVP